MKTHGAAAMMKAEFQLCADIKLMFKHCIHRIDIYRIGYCQMYYDWIFRTVLLEQGLSEIIFHCSLCSFFTVTVKSKGLLFHTY